VVKAQGTLREYPGGAPVSGATVTIKLEADDSTITTDTTDADGRWQYSANGSPGPWRWEGVEGTVTRVGSSATYGSGGAYALYELIYALRALGNGVVEGYLNALAVTYDAAGLDLDVNTGAAIAKGIIANFPSVTDHSVVTSRDATHPKACYLVVEFTGAGEAAEGKAVIKDVCGSAAASPTLPSLTQSEATYQVPLATFTLPNTGSTTLTNVTDARTYPSQRNPVVSATAYRLDPAVTTTTTSTTGADVTWTSGSASPTLLSGVTYDIEARATLSAKVTAGQTVSIAPYIDGTTNIAPYVASNLTDYALISNVHTLEGVVGAGAGITCGLRWKVSGGTGTATTGTLSIIARPRT
jgi:hypothetical protein